MSSLSFGPSVILSSNQSQRRGAAPSVRVLASIFEIAERRARARNARHHRSDRDAQKVGALLIAEALDRGQVQHRAMMVGKRGETVRDFAQPRMMFLRRAAAVAADRYCWDDILAGVAALYGRLAGTATVAALARVA